MKYKVTLNDKTYEVEVEQGKAMLVDEYEAYAPAAPAPVVPAAPAAAPAAPAAPAAVPQNVAVGEVIKSPMPGNILKIPVSLGQKVEEGDVIVLLEAMKMENEIVATKAGTVVQILTTKGAVVETNTPLAVIG